MAVPVIMPKQGQSVETCIITQWLKNKGDAVKKGDLLFSYETDKASFDGESEEEGILLEVFYKEGDEVPVLSNIAVIGNKGEAFESFRPGLSGGEPSVEANIESKGTSDYVSEEKKEIVTGFKKKADIAHSKGIDVAGMAGASGSIETPAMLQGGKVRISPRARAMASSLGIQPAGIAGSGPNGRIIVRDIEAAAKKASTVAQTAHTLANEPVKQSGPPAEHLVSMHADFEDRKLSNVRKLIARSMHESITRSAQLTHHMSADVRRLLALRARTKEAAASGSAPNITLNDMVCFAVIQALAKFPEINSHFLGDSLRTFRKVHLGLAVDTPRGLMVPAIPNASDFSLPGLSERLAEAAGQCRKGNINPELLASTSATFTVSNLGNYGVEMFTPIINLPQVAILGVNTITYRPADIGNGVIGFIPVMGLSLTYDHRAVDGGPATLFLKEIKDRIEQFDEKI